MTTFNPNVGNDSKVLQCYNFLINRKLVYVLILLNDLMDGLKIVSLLGLALYQLFKKNLGIVPGIVRGTLE